MAAIGWIWAWLMLLGGTRAYLNQSMPHDLTVAIILSGIVALPILWSRKNGIFATVAPSGIVRAGLAILILVIAGIGDPAAIAGLLPGLLPGVA